MALTFPVGPMPLPLLHSLVLLGVAYTHVIGAALLDRASMGYPIYKVHLSLPYIGLGEFEVLDGVEGCDTCDSTLDESYYMDWFCGWYVVSLGEN